MAKSMEDTAFYRFGRLLALNEVGGNPTSDELSVRLVFTSCNDNVWRPAPDGLTATATHDTKRGEDARARILALSEIAADWNAVDPGLAQPQCRPRAALGRRRLPTKTHEYMIYQTLVGAWPGSIGETLFVNRVQAYALKAAREEKQETSWTDPNETYETALAGFVARLLDANLRRLSGLVQKFAERAALLGALNSLSQLALKVTLPGVPDFYQGTELLGPVSGRPR